VVEQFRPDVVLMSLGIDAHYRDPLTSLVLSSPGYVELVARSAALATRLCGNRLAVALEGGYHLDALGEVIAGVVGHFRGRSTRLALSEVLDHTGRGKSAVEATIRARRPFWNLRRPVVPLPLLDDVVDLVIRVLRLVLEPADFHEELLALPESREELHDVLGRDDPHGLVFLGHDDRGDVVLGHHLDRAMHVRVGPDREGR